MHTHVIFNVYYISSISRNGVGNFQYVEELFSPLRQSKYKGKSPESNFKDLAQFLKNNIAIDKTYNKLCQGIAVAILTA